MKKGTKLIKLDLKLNGEHLKSRGNSFSSALEVLGNKIKKFNTKGVLTVEKEGKVSKEIILTIPNLKKIFTYGLSGEIQRTVIEKRITILGGL